MATRRKGDRTFDSSWGLLDSQASSKWQAQPTATPLFCLPPNYLPLLESIISLNMH
ncbi:hypothetical protein SKAU_G00375620 [Synaphobranchus kaupii]|uniref:Uncharacterized protein n=1 Tax=Synaphobranchus kaupii TaxID=118154 RepID=A0A9Q1IGE4_SYNKA|nr:hypothetical protein SKAU_G00375620 [Synaphobranchus kaupii]